MAATGFFAEFAAVAVFGPLVPRFAALLHLSPAGWPIGGNRQLEWIDFTHTIWRMGGSGCETPVYGAIDSGAHWHGRTYRLVTGGLPGSCARYLSLATVVGYIGWFGDCNLFPVGIAQVSYWFSQSRQGGSLGSTQVSVILDQAFFRFCFRWQWLI